MQRALILILSLICPVVLFAQTLLPAFTPVYPTVTLPAVGVSVIEDNLQLHYTGVNTAMAQFGEGKANYTASVSSYRQTDKSSANTIVTPQMLRRQNQRAVSGSFAGSQSAFSSTVVQLNEQGISVIPQVNAAVAPIKRAGVIPNPDDNRETSGSENGPIGDALLPLLLMAGIFVLGKRKVLRTHKTIEN